MLGSALEESDAATDRVDVDLADLGCSVISHVRGSHTVATFGPFVVGFSGVNVGMGGLDAFSLANAQVVRKHGRVGHLLIFCEGCSIPTREERASMVDILRSFNGQIIACGAVLLESSGLGPVVLRSLVRVIARIGRSAFERRTFSGLEGSTQWLAGMLPDEAASFPAEQLDRIVAELLRTFQ